MSITWIMVWRYGFGEFTAILVQRNMNYLHKISL